MHVYIFQLLVVEYNSFKTFFNFKMMVMDNNNDFI